MQPLVARVATVAMLASSFFATAYAEQKNEPTVVIEEMRHDLGRVYESDSYKHAFKVENTGTADLRITEVKPGCGCTIAEYDEVIPPGGEGFVTLVVKGQEVEDKWSKRADVYTNDPKHPQLIVWLEGTVVRYVSVDPTRIHLRGGYGEPVSADIRVFSEKLKGDLEVVSVASDVDDKITYRVVPDPEPGYYTIQVHKNPRLPTLNEWGSIFITTNSEESPEKVVQVNIVTRGEIIVQPSSVNFGTLTDQELDGVEQSITLSKTKGIFRIQGVEFSDPGYKANVVPIEAGKKYKVTVNYHPGELHDGSQIDEMIIKTDDPNEPSIRVRLISRSAI